MSAWSKKPLKHVKYGICREGQKQKFNLQSDHKVLHPWIRWTLATPLFCTYQQCLGTSQCQFSPPGFYLSVQYWLHWGLESLIDKGHTWHREIMLAIFPAMSSHQQYFEPNKYWETDMGTRKLHYWNNTQTCNKGLSH